MKACVFWPECGAARGPDSGAVTCPHAGVHPVSPLEHCRLDARCLECGDPPDKTQPAPRGQA
jgi:hypothetical protein